MRAGAVLIAAAIALLAGGIAFAGNARYGPREGYGARILDRIARRLELTDGQRTSMHEIVEQHMQAGLGDAADKARVAHRDLRGVIHDPSTDETAVRDAAMRAAAADANLAVERHRTFVDAYAVLTPEQRDKAKALRERFLER